MICSNAYGADPVARWTADGYLGGNWVSSVGTAQAVPTGTPSLLTDAFNAHEGMDLDGNSYFVVPAGSNPLAGATQLTLVAVFNPTSGGNPGTNWFQASGLIGMEQNGAVSDWGLGWSDTRASAGIGGPDITMYSKARGIEEPVIAILTWNNTTGVQKLFVNGVLVDSDYGVPLEARNGGAFALGAMTDTGATPFVGQIAELQMYATDESANVATITSGLRAEYFAPLELVSSKLNATGGSFVIEDTPGSTVNGAGTFQVAVNAVPLAPGDFTANKVGTTTTVTFTSALTRNTLYGIDLTVPRTAGGDQVFFVNAYTPLLPATIPGQAGGVGSWGISETVSPATGAPGTIATALDFVVAGVPAPVNGTAPVFNHRDPNTNDTNNCGNFNNDFPILTNTGADDGFVVVGKTKVTVPAAGIYTFSVHSDDGFAMRVTGAGGGRFVSTGGEGVVDLGDNQTLFRDGGTGDSNSRGVYQFNAAGTYDIEYLGWDGGSGGYYEVAWAPGGFGTDRETNTWQLVGTPTDPSIPPFAERFAVNLPGPTGTDGNFGVRTYTQSTGVDSLAAASNFLATTTRTPADGITFDTQTPVLNHRDPQAPDSGGLVAGDSDFPGNTGVDDNNVVTVAKGRIQIPTAGPYTFRVQADDGFMLRVKPTNGNPEPKFKRVSQPNGNQNGRFQMSNPNEMYYIEANSETRGTIDLLAGTYDLEFFQIENGGGFYYELCSAAGEWPIGTNPPTGFPLVGYVATVTEALFPGIASPGWTVQSSLPNRPEDAAFGFSIPGAEARINATLALPTPPANATSIWDRLDFRDPQDGPEGSFTPTNPWPLDTATADDNYAMRATGNLVITQAGLYDLGFQGDDGGYMFVTGLGGNADPTLTLVSTNHPAQAVIGPAVSGGPVNNAIRVDTGSGNSRTIVRAQLEVGQYQIKTLVFEGGGGSWWEVIGASSVDVVAPRLLVAGAGTSIPIISGLDLQVQPVVVPNDPTFRVTSVTTTGNNPVTSVQFSFGSQTGATYTIQGSTDLTTWITVASNVPATGTSTPFTVNLEGFEALNGQPKVFFRVLNP